MKGFFAYIGILIGVVTLFVGLVFGIPYLAAAVNRTGGVALESSRTDMYRESKSYVEGTIRDLRDLKMRFETADEEHKSAIQSLILQRAGELDWDRLPSDLRSFVKDLN